MHVLAQMLLFLLANSKLVLRIFDVKKVKNHNLSYCYRSHTHPARDDPLEHGPQISEWGTFHSLQANPLEQSLSFQFRRLP